MPSHFSEDIYVVLLLVSDYWDSRPQTIHGERQETAEDIKALWHQREAELVSRELMRKGDYLVFTFDGIYLSIVHIFL